jgi:hypothetical protein
VRTSFRESAAYAPIMFGSGVILAYDTDKKPYLQRRCAGSWRRLTLHAWRITFL